MSFTLGKTTTPTTGTHGYIFDGTHSQVFMPFTTTKDGLYKSVTFWAAGASTLKLHGAIWVSPSDDAVAFGPGVNTSGGAASGVGATQWYTDTFATPVFIAAGTTIFIGWQRDAASGTIYWAYNGSDHSPNAQWFTGHGATGQNITGATFQSPAGAVAAYATYDLAGGLGLASGGSFTKFALKRYDSASSTWKRHPLKRWNSTTSAWEWLA